MGKRRALRIDSVRKGKTMGNGAAHVKNLAQVSVLFPVDKAV
jgi:hypothetical protein